LQELPPDEKSLENHPEKQEKVFYSLINTEEELQKLQEILLKQEEICIGTETTSLNPLTSQLIGIGFCFEEKKAWYIPFNGNLDQDLILNFLNKIISSNIKFYGHDIKYTLHVLANYKIYLTHICFDTILASYLLSPQNRKHNLDILTLDYFNKVKISYKELTTLNKKPVPLKDVDIEKVSAYCCEDVDYTCRLKNLFSKKITEKKFEKILYDIEMPLLSILMKMERAGIYLDEKKFEKLNEKTTLELEILEKEIFKETNCEFNINSPKQLSEVLFKKLNLPLPSNAKTEFSTGSAVLEKLAPKSEVVKKIISYRTLKKLLSTYIKALPKQINTTTHRIHPTFNQAATATGRLSCQDPNLQNIPIKTTEGKEIRNGFKPQKQGWSFISADYSQIELRLLAHFSEDEDLIKAFQNNEDIHALTASLVFNIPLNEVTSKMRGIAKAVNFGTLYGQGAYGLSQLINIPFKEANEFIKKYFEKYKKVTSYIEKTKLETLDTKISKTLIGRERPIPEIDSKNQFLRQAAQRLAVNTPLQGTAADIIKIAMIAIDKEIKKYKLHGFMILQIHDELIFEVPDDEIPTFKKILEKEMENTLELRVPLTINLQVGKNWGEC
jgi:DNA polymerase-1